MIEPQKPTQEDFVAHARVEEWFRWMRHEMAVRRGEASIVGEPLGTFVETEYGREPLTDDVMRSMGWTVVRSETGEISYEK